MTDSHRTNVLHTTTALGMTDRRKFMGEFEDVKAKRAWNRRVHPQQIPWWDTEGTTLQAMALREQTLMDQHNVGRNVIDDPGLTSLFNSPPPQSAAGFLGLQTGGWTGAAPVAHHTYRRALHHKNPLGTYHVVYTPKAPEERAYRSCSTSTH
jgi:hypothetical protein